MGGLRTMNGPSHSGKQTAYAFSHTKFLVLGMPQNTALRLRA